MTTTLGILFGLTSSQSSDQITIQKSELPFTPLAQNNEEQIFAAIVKRAKFHLRAEFFDKYLDRNIVIEDGITERAYRTENDVEVPYIKTQVIISFYARDEDSTGGILPDRY
jgi:hypothetical protein